MQKIQEKEQTFPEFKQWLLSGGTWNGQNKTKIAKIATLTTAQKAELRKATNSNGNNIATQATDNSRNSELITLLFENIEDTDHSFINHKNNAGKSPLAVVITETWPGPWLEEVVEILLHYGADPNNAADQPADKKMVLNYIQEIGLKNHVSNLAHDLHAFTTTLGVK
jgi:hypothetical protein